MRQTGSSLAAEFPGRQRATASLHARARAASEFLNHELGAVTHVVRKNGGFVVQGHGCPLAAITGKEPAVCLAVESLLQSDRRRRRPRMLRSRAIVRAAASRSIPLNDLVACLLARSARRLLRLYKYSLEYLCLTRQLASSERK